MIQFCLICQYLANVKAAAVAVAAAATAATEKAGNPPLSRELL